MREFIQQFGGAYISTEGALWRTLKLLLIKPGELTAQYLAGRRKHYVLPLRLYLTIALVAAAVIRLSSFSANEMDARIGATQSNSEPRRVGMYLLIGKAEVKDGIFYCEGLPQWLCQRAKSRMDVGQQAVSQRLHTVYERVVNNVGVILFALLPAFALSLMLVFLNRRMRYAEHAVLALHLHAFGALVLALMSFELRWVNWLGSIVVLLYALLAMKRVYGGRWWVLLLRLSALTAVHATVAVLVTSVAVLVAFLA